MDENKVTIDKSITSYSQRIIRLLLALNVAQPVASRCHSADGFLQAGTAADDHHRKYGMYAGDQERNGKMLFL